MTRDAPATVYLVDDDDGVRGALAMLIGTAGIAVRDFADGRAFLRDFRRDGPCCLVLDLRMPGIGGMELQAELAAKGWKPPIIFLTGYADVSVAVKAIKDGAFDFIEKPVRDGDDLLRRVRAALQLDAETLATDARRTAAQARLATLTVREREVMEGVCAGKANKVIANDLGISERTVELHRAHLMHKLGVRSVAVLISLKDDAQGE